MIVAGASGCTRTGTDTQNKTTTPPTTASTQQTYSHCAQDLTQQQAKHSRGEPVIRSSEFTPTGDWTSAEWVVASSRDRDGLTYSTEATDVDKVKEYIEDTDLSKKSILIHQYSFDKCTTLQVNRVLWEETNNSSGGEFDLVIEFEDIDSDENCTKGTITTAMRIPSAIEEVATLQWATFSSERSHC